MDTEFHYYITCLIALRAGFSSSDAYKIAYSSQYIDDNYNDIKIYDIQKNLIYQNVLTQSYNAFKSTSILNTIYPVYHFVPHPIKNKKSIRKDQKIHALDTHADNLTVNLVLQAALKSGNPYWIGIASHAFVDSWSHQNFTGTFDCYNAIPGILRSIIYDIGHADMAADPDYVGHIWRDKRLINEEIDNNKRFIIAALRLLEEYLKYFQEPMSARRKLLKETAKELKSAFGQSTKYLIYNLMFSQPKRMKQYHELSKSYDQLDIHKYSRTEWIKEALIKPWHSNAYNWRNQKTYTISNWYLFQTAAKTHQKFIWPLIENKLN